MELDELWNSQSKIDGEILKMYMDSQYLPRRQGRNLDDRKKMRLDLEQYRCRFVDSTFGCVMANYGFAHLLPMVNLKTHGLFGTLLVTPNAMRFLSIPEIAILMGALSSVWLPKDHRTATRLLGNGISSQHAMTALVNGLAFLRELSPVEVHEIFIEAMQCRMTASNIKISEKWDGHFFEIDRMHADPP